LTKSAGKAYNHFASLSVFKRTVILLEVYEPPGGRKSGVPPKQPLDENYVHKEEEVNEPPGVQGITSS
jgi:hypothetical protein